MTTAIFDFLNERKAAWLKAKLPKDAGSDVQQQLEQEAGDRFALASWLPDAARRVSQLSMVSHPGKFSHPSAKTSSIIASASYAADGYLRSGNVDYALDVFGNAAAMDVYKFLSIVLSGRMIKRSCTRKASRISRILLLLRIERTFSTCH